MLKKLCITLFITLYALLAAIYAHSSFANNPPSFDITQWYLCDTAEITDDFRI